MAFFKYSNKLKTLGYQNIALLFIVMSLIALCFNLNRSIDLASQEQLIRLEPDLRVGTVRKAWEVPNSFVYSFALTVVQKINNWQLDGGKEYSENLMALQNYITPSCREFLHQDYVKKQRSGQLQNRSRVVMEVSGLGFNDQSSTRLIERGIWTVDLTLNVREHIAGKPVKKVDVFWPVRVVEFNIDPELNPQGLALDCLATKPTQLKDYRM